MSKEIFFLGDSHFGHDAIIRHANRPWKTIEEHDEALISNWNKTVSKGDLVYHLGDFAMIKQKEGGQDRMREYRKLRSRLNGKIILAGLGNHDKMSQETYNNCFSEVHKFLERKINGFHFTMCHYPLLSWNRSYHNHKHPDNLKNCNIMLHGHCHNRLHRDNPYRIDTGVDGWNYKPILFDEIIKNIELYKKSSGSNNRPLPI